MTRHRILVTNDDGIHSPGLDVAERIARSLSDDVWVVAPENEQSGASHSLTLAAPLRLRALGKRRFAVSGTPTDCVMMACLHLLKDNPPTLVLSGVNWGSNLADDVTYSGTIAGAMEGCALGIDSIALSQAHEEGARNAIDWSAGEAHGPALVRRLVEAGWPKGTLMNVNFPGCPAEEVKGVAVVPQGKYDLQSTEIEERIDARQRAYYWIGLRRRRASPPSDSDLGAVYAGRIAVTPLHLNLTEAAVLEKLRGTLGKS
ncbi:MAG TPA: 5'/3'-nucleotidase SurE [Rhizomicrobium sp.]|jgi:5'-nucleotidase|nr:5'/3'-nucleotidase SurE [Rhizomicrobium sp.]